MDVQMKSKPTTVPLFGSTRFAVYICLYLATLLCIAIRYSINMSIVCMVVPIQNRNTTHFSVNFTNEDFWNNTESISSSSNSPSCGNDLATPTDFGYKGEFYWSRKQVGYILSAYFYGYVPMQLIGGWMSDRFGIRHVLGSGMLIGGLLSLLTPVAARLHYGVLIGLRILIGFIMGVMFTCVQSCIGKWVPISEKGTYVGLVFSGPSSGIIVSFVLSGFLCPYSWTYVFYILGGLVVLWYILFMFVVYPTPDDHPRISAQEKAYLAESTSEKGPQKSVKIPWKQLLCNKHTLALCVNQFCFVWVLNITNAGIPLFMQDVLKFNIKSNGVLSATPQLIQTITGPPLGIGLDVVYRKLIKDRLTLRRTCQSIFYLGSIVCVLVISFMNCSQRNLAVLMFCLVYLVMFFIRGGSTSSPSDMAPRMAGSLFGVTNFVGNCAAFLVPITIGNLTPTGSQEEWQRIFYLSCGIMGLGWLSYVIFVTADEQQWAKVGNQVDVVETQVVLKPLTGVQDSTLKSSDNGHHTFEEDSLQKGLI